MRWRFLPPLLLALWIPSHSQGEEILTLQQALEMARTANPQFRMSGEDLNVAKAGLSKAKVIPNPEIDFKGGTHSNNAPGTASEFVGGELSQEIELWGTRSLRKKSAQKGIEAALAREAQTWLDTAFRVKEGYYQSLLQQHLLSIARENLEIGRKFLGSTELKFKENEVPFSHVLRARLELVRFNKELIAHQEDLKIAKSDLNLLLGREPEYPFRVQDAFSRRSLVRSLENLDPHQRQRRVEGEAPPALPVEGATRAPMIDDLVSQAQEKHPALQEATAEVEREDLDLKLAKRRRFPKPTFSFWGEKDSDDTHFGGGVGFEIPLWYRRKGEIDEAKSLKERAQIGKDSMMLQVDRDVRNAFRELTKTAKMLEVEEEGISSSAELIRTTFQAYQEGSAPFLQVLETLTAVNQFREDYFTTLAGWHIHKAALEKATGGIGGEIVLFPPISAEASGFAGARRTRRDE